jgi:type IV pilus assembly protein PilV
MRLHSPPPAAARKTPKSAAGFFLTEVLVSIIVLSIGLLGMVAMQASALKANREARVHSTAVVLARELAEMIRGNKDIGLLARSNPYLGSFKAPFASSDYCLSVDTPSCATPTDIAEAQMTEWLARVDAHLPGARVDVCFDATPFDQNGQPQWACTGNGKTVVVKMGWTLSSTDQSAPEEQAFNRAQTPSLILPVTLG